MELWLKKRIFGCSQSEKKRAKKEKPKKKPSISAREFEKDNVYKEDIEFLRLIDSFPDPTRAKLAEYLCISKEAVCLRIKKLKEFAGKKQNKLVKEVIDARLSRIREEKRGRKGKEKDFSHILKEDKEVREDKEKEIKDKKNRGQREGKIEYCSICGTISYPDGPNGRKCINRHRWVPKNTKSRTVVTSEVKNQDSFKRSPFGGANFYIGWSEETEE